ncbi:hypothetical protein [Actinoplanes sp. GCM10030250]|uniref:hypothetical protein n=1 Tax=Actinoplanes sp. GCM10030250 TaxID=3273376 RepID=UPI00360DDECC
MSDYPDPSFPWATVVVRAWVQEGRCIVRMTFADADRGAVVFYEPSGSAAGRRLARWLDEFSGHAPEAGPAPGDEGETPRRRSGIAPFPSVSDRQQGRDEET